MESGNYIRPFGFDTGKGRKLSNMEESLNVRLIDTSKEDYSTFENRYVEIVTHGSKEYGAYQETTESGNLILSPTGLPNILKRKTQLLILKKLAKTH